jgi:hypothetical protein
MKVRAASTRRLDPYALETIVVLALITLFDFLLSDVLSLPVALRSNQLAVFKSIEGNVRAAGFLVPAFVFTALVVLWLVRQSAWQRRLAIAYLAWVTLRLTVETGLIVFIVISHPQVVVGVLLKDTAVLWVLNVVLFGLWYWIIDAGGPRARRDGLSPRYDFAFPQRTLPIPGWANWQPGIWDYLFLGFSGSTQFGLGDTNLLSWRAKSLLMLQVALSMTILVFLASFAISLMR